MRTARSLSAVCALSALLHSACEVVADFDPDKLEGQRTVQPTPIPGLDSSVPLVPDGSIRSDASIVRPSEFGPDAAAGLDASALDGAASPTATSDGGDGGDEGVADAASLLPDAGDVDASL